MYSSEVKISAEVVDWTRESLTKYWEPSKQLLKAIRKYQSRSQDKGLVSKLARIYYVFWYRLWSVITSADIPINCKIGGGLLLPHPDGVVIHPDAEIGINCLIFQQVTIVEGVKIKGHVDIGAGAKIIRPVTIGKHAKIGANAVILTDIPDGATAVGIPARVVPRKI